MLVRARFVGCLHVAEALDELALKILMPHHVEHDVAAARAGRGRWLNIEAHIILIAEPRFLLPRDTRRRRHPVE